jgi:hypothetical protein
MSERNVALMTLGAIGGALLGLWLTNVWGALVGAVVGAFILRKALGGRP